MIPEGPDYPGPPASPWQTVGLIVVAVLVVVLAGLGLVAAFQLVLS